MKEECHCERFLQSRHRRPARYLGIASDENRPRNDNLVFILPPSSFILYLSHQFCAFQPILLLPFAIQPCKRSR